MTMADNRGPSVGVSVPALESSVDLFRTVLTSVATQLDFNLEQISEVGLAAEEACAYLLTSYPGPERLGMSVTTDDSLLEVTFSLAGPGEGTPSEPRRRRLLREVLSTLADGLDLDAIDGAPAVRFRKSSSH